MTKVIQQKGLQILDVGTVGEVDNISEYMQNVNHVLIGKIVLMSPVTFYFIFKLG